MDTSETILLAIFGGAIGGAFVVIAAVRILWARVWRGDI